MDKLINAIIQAIINWSNYTNYYNFDTRFIVIYFNKT